MRRAVTLVELLCAIAVIMTMMGLFLPAVQNARSSAARHACLNNLKSLALASHNYHNTHGSFPPGRGTPNPRIFSAHSYLLGELEQDNLAAIIDFTSAPASYTATGVSYSGDVNAEGAMFRVSAFICPADRLVGQVPGTSYIGTNYAANAGSGANFGSLANADGIFFTGSKVRLAEISDGTSHTALFAERPLGGGPGNMEQPRMLLELPGNNDPSAQVCQQGEGLWNSEKGAKWIVGNYGNTLYNHALPPNALAFDCTNATQQKGRMAARGNHTGGVTVAFADGSTRFVPNTIDMANWTALGSRAGGESSDW